MPARSLCFSRICRLLLAGVLSLATLVGPAFGHGGYHERLAYLNGEVKKNPSDPRLHFELGDLYGQHGDLQLALDHLDRVDALAPGKFLTDLQRGQALLVAGQPAKAKKALDGQIASHPECAPAHLLRARASQRIGEGAASLADYREAWRSTPSPESRAEWKALVEHLAALPKLERGSHAMSKLIEEARQAIASLASLSASTQPIPTPTKPKP